MSGARVPSNAIDVRGAISRAGFKDCPRRTFGNDGPDRVGLALLEFGLQTGDVTHEALPFGDALVPFRSKARTAATRALLQSRVAEAPN